MTTSVSRPQVPALTSLRFFAALHVFLFHLDAIKIKTFTGVANRLQMIGYVGVSLFFVLSGFILTYVHGERELTPSVFYRERVARIYPAYLFSLVVTAPGFFYVCIVLKNMDIPFFAWFKTHVGVCAAMVPTLTQSWHPQAALAWNPPAWSLSVEAFFYILFPFLLPRLLRWTDRNLVILIAACCAVSFTLPSLYCWLKPDGVANVSDASLTLWWLNALKFNPLARLPEFLLGASCGVLFLRGKFNRRWAVPLTLASLIAFVTVMLASPHIPYPLLHNGILPPAFAALVVGLALRPAFMSWMNYKPLVLLGNASYSLYLLHSFVLGVYFVPEGKLKTYGPLGTAIGYVLPVVIAILVYRFIEEPARRKLRPKSQIRTVTVAQTA
ncbi:MAG TPA: acyltransferase [Terriglobales bacterium]|nr:acyltransferase [Terriglobales bacterium]